MNNYIFHLFILVSCFGYAQYTQIPDPNFEQALIDQGIDSEGILNGQVLTDDIDTITTLNISSKNISDVTGIQDFIALENLYAHNNDILEINLSNHQNIKKVDIYLNALHYANFENATSLETLILYGEVGIVELGDNLNITNCTQLKFIDASASLTSIDLSTNVALEEFYSGHWEAPHLDVFSELDFSNNPNLTDVAVFYNAELVQVNLNNGHNDILINLFFDGHDEIPCFQVDDAEAANNGANVYANWYVHNDQEFSEDCYIGVNEFESRSYTFYPNPTSNLVYSSEPSIDVDEIVMYDQQGKFIKRFSSFPIDISNFNKGFYILKIKLCDEHVIYDKILKE